MSLPYSFTLKDSSIDFSDPLLDFLPSILVCCEPESDQKVHKLNPEFIFNKRFIPSMDLHAVFGRVDIDTGKSVLRDYINATVGFEALGAATEKSTKSLRRAFKSIKITWKKGAKEISN